ncbi:MAG: HlyD family efflux transporter periplasmic adaptor subunit, partial [Planctomycetota bacterium]
TTGVVVPFREVALAAEVSGRVTWKAENLLPGKYVQQGQELLRIDDRDYKLEVARLEQQVAKANADLLRSKVDQENAVAQVKLAKDTLALRTRDLERMEKLRVNLASSEAEYDAAENMLVDAKQALTTQENALRGLEAEATSLTTSRELAKIGLEQAKLDLSRTVIRAPFAGVIIENLAEANTHVQVGARVARIEDTSKVEVRCSLRKEDLEFLPSDGEAAGGDLSDSYHLPAVPATVRYTRAGRTYSWKAVLSRQDGLGMDQRTRTMPVRVLVNEPLASTVDNYDADARSIALVRGMFVHVDLHCQPQQSLLTIPEESLRPGKTVWLMEDEKLAIHPVQVVRIENRVAYIDSRNATLGPNHAVISSPVPGAKEGLAVTTQLAKRGGAGPGGRGGRGTAGGGDSNGGRGANALGARGGEGGRRGAGKKNREAVSTQQATAAKGSDS